MRLDTQKYQEVLDLMASFQTQTTKTETKSRHYIPFAENPRFWGREDVLSQIDRALCTNGSDKSFKSFAIYGMGGVGKTQIALRYANQSRHKYEGIFWISAENSLTIAQGFREIAKTLDLIQLETETDDNAVMMEVKKWLSATSECIYNLRPYGPLT